VDANGKFYNEGATNSLAKYGNKEEKRDLNQLGVTILGLDEANAFWFDSFFDSLRTSHSQNYASYECLPKSKFCSVPIPYDITELDDYDIEGKAIELILEDHVNNCFSELKYLFCGHPNDPIALRFKKFDMNIIYTLTCGRANYCFVLFDASLEKAFLFHFDLCITVFTRKDAAKDEQLGEISDAIWIKYFNDKFVKGSTGVQHHLDIINQNYVPRLKGIKHFSFLAVN